MFLCLVLGAALKTVAHQSSMRSRMNMGKYQWQSLLEYVPQNPVLTVSCFFICKLNVQNLSSLIDLCHGTAALLKFDQTHE